MRIQKPQKKIYTIPLDLTQRYIRVLDEYEEVPNK